MSTGCLIGHRRRRRGKPVLRRKDPTGVRSPQRKQVPDTPDRVYANLTAGKSQSSPEGRQAEQTPPLSQPLRRGDCRAVDALPVTT
jgi:hypothetical protein